jgi:hypothetical protein
MVVTGEAAELLDAAMLMPATADSRSIITALAGCPLAQLPLGSTIGLRAAPRGGNLPVLNPDLAGA